MISKLHSISFLFTYPSLPLFKQVFQHLSEVSYLHRLYFARIGNFNFPFYLRSMGSVAIEQSLSGQDIMDNHLDPYIMAITCNLKVKRTIAIKLELTMLELKELEQQENH